MESVAGGGKRETKDLHWHGVVCCFVRLRREYDDSLTRVAACGSFTNINTENPDSQPFLLQTSNPVQLSPACNSDDKRKVEVSPQDKSKIPSVASIMQSRRMDHLPSILSLERCSYGKVLVLSLHRSCGLAFLDVQNQKQQLKQRDGSGRKSYFTNSRQEPSAPTPPAE